MLEPGEFFLTCSPGLTTSGGALFSGRTKVALHPLGIPDLHFPGSRGTRDPMKKSVAGLTGETCAQQCRIARTLLFMHSLDLGGPVSNAPFQRSRVRSPLFRGQAAAQKMRVFTSFPSCQTELQNHATSHAECIPHVRIQPSRLVHKVPTNNFQNVLPTMHDGAQCGPEALRRNFRRNCWVVKWGSLGCSSPAWVVH